MLILCSLRRTFGFVVAVSLLACSSVVMADGGQVGDNLWDSQPDAYAACLSQQSVAGWTKGSCTLNFDTPDAGSNSACGGNPVMHWAGHYVASSDTGGAHMSYYWCTAAECSAGASPGGASDYTMYDPGAYLSGGGVADQGGCCATLDFVQAAWGMPDKSDATATGHFVLNGSRCHSNLSGSDAGGTIPKPSPLKPFSHCKPGVASCYNPFDDNFCSQSESGEWFCVPRQTPDPGGCISGATGSECLGKDGNPVPNPPDPPIKNGTPPDSTNNYTINDAGTTNNYITNNYSGTSLGPQSSSPPTSSPGGTGSNTSGNGNTGKNGTDSNGNCPNGSKPTASGCSGTYTDNGCDTPPACFGDAVLCGIAANTHKSACAASGGSVGSPPSGLDGDPTDNSGDPTSSAVSSSVDLGDATGSLDGSGFGYSSSCPLQDVSFSVFGQSVDIPFADKCDKLAFLKYIVLALAYFMAAKIIAGVQ